MNTDNSIKNSIISIVLSAIMCAGGALVSDIDWLVATLMTASITLMGIAGAYLIKASWMRHDANPNKRDLRRLDFNPMS
jgi:hypothetical protein